MNVEVESLPVLLQKVREMSVTDMRNTLADFDLTEQQWRVISSVAEQGEINAQDLAENSAILGPSLSRILCRLESDGVLSKKASRKDQRELVISLTASGKRLYKRVSPKVSKSFDGFSSLVGDTKVRQLMNKLNEVLKKTSV